MSQKHKDNHGYARLQDSIETGSERKPIREAFANQPMGIFIWHTDTNGNVLYFTILFHLQIDTNPHSHTYTHSFTHSYTHTHTHTHTHTFIQTGSLTNKHTAPREHPYKYTK